MEKSSRKDVNIIVLTGEISSKLSLNTMKSGQKCLRFDLKNNETFLLKDGTKANHENYFPIEVIGRNAEIYYNDADVEKGARVQITGYLRQDYLDDNSLTRVRCLHMHKE